MAKITSLHFSPPCRSEVTDTEARDWSFTGTRASQVGRLTEMARGPKERSAISRQQKRHEFSVLKLKAGLIAESLDVW